MARLFYLVLASLLGSCSSYVLLATTAERRARAALAKATRKAAREAADEAAPPPQQDEVDPGAVPGTGLRILTYPHPKLRAPNADISSFDADLQRLAREMFSVMYASRGVGLAAPQVGVNLRLMVFNPEGDASRKAAEVVLCNPRIVGRTDETDVQEEGCLSFPGFTADVARATSIEVEYQTPRGKRMRKRLRDEWVARIFQHEYDHLDGTLYIDRLDACERARVSGDLDGLVRGYAAEQQAVEGPAAL